MIQGLYKIFDHWHQEGTLYIYSDPHFNDPDLKKGVERPSADELVKLINSKVGRKDTIVILGDICDIEYVKKIRGYKVLIMGNHDKGRTNYERKIYVDRFDADKYTLGEALAEAKKRHKDCRYESEEVHQYVKPFLYWEIRSDNMLFDEVYEGPLMIAEKLILSHEPIDVPWAFNIHGHRHTKQPNDDHHLNACLDATGYQIFNLNQLMKSGLTSKVETIHRDTIDRATERKRRRGGKKYGTK